MIITPILIVVLAVLGLLAILWLAKSLVLVPRLPEDPAAHMRSVDVEAFRNLVDPAEALFLRSSLSPRQFRKIQRERLQAAVEYVSGAAHNAAILLRIGQAARLSADPATAEAARKLVDNAIQLRLYSLKAITRLYLAMLLPATPISPAPLAERYEQMTRLVVLLGCLQYPTRGISAAL